MHDLFQKKHPRISLEKEMSFLWIKKKKVTFQAKDLFYYLEISSLAWAFFFFREVLMEGLFIKVR